MPTVNLDALSQSSNQVDQSRYHHYINLFAEAILKHVDRTDIHCKTAYELKLRELEENNDTIVDEVVAGLAVRPTPPVAVGQWCGFFRACCPSCHQVLRDVELGNPTGKKLKQDHPHHPLYS